MLSRLQRTLLQHFLPPKSLADTIVTSPEDTYSAFHSQLLASHIITDSWVDGRERFAIAPHILLQEEYHALNIAAERLGEAMNEAAKYIWNSPELLDSYFMLTESQKRMWFSSGGCWHVIARFDLFVLPDGTIRMCEVNADTPSGEAEAVLLNRMVSEKHPEFYNPNQHFEDTFYHYVREMALFTSGTFAAVGIIYPTDMPEDLSMVLLYKQLFEKHGHTVILGSPYNIRRASNGKLSLFGSEIDVLLRHYKTDWWGEREQIWLDAEEFPDPDPIEPQLTRVLRAGSEGHTTIINPFGAVVVQNKCMMAFLHDYKHHFSTETQDVIYEYIPETRRMVDVDTNQLNREEWVLKTVFGCEGDEVLIGRTMSDEQWNLALDLAIDRHWILQKYFEPRRSDGRIANYGVYLLAGNAAGIFTRLSPGATDLHSLSAATLVDMQ